MWLLAYMVWVLVCVCARAQERQFADDALLVFHFDDDLADAAGSSPALSGDTSPTFVTGVFGTPALALVGPVFNSPPLGVLPAGNSAFSVSLWVEGALECCGPTIAMWGGPPGCCVDPPVYGSVRFVLPPGSAAQTSTGVYWGPAYTMIPPPLVFDGEFHHYAFTYDGVGGAALYVDGALSSSSSDALFATVPGSPLVVGGSAFNSIRTRSAAIDELRVYNRSLTADEVLELFTGAPLTPTATPTATATGTPSRTATESASGTPSSTASATPSASSSAAAPATPSPTVPGTPPGTPSAATSPSPVPSPTETESVTSVATPSAVPRVDAAASPASVALAASLGTVATLLAMGAVAAAVVVVRRRALRRRGPRPPAGGSGGGFGSGRSRPAAWWAALGGAAPMSSSARRPPKAAGAAAEAEAEQGRWVHAPLAEARAAAAVAAGAARLLSGGTRAPLRSAVGPVDWSNGGAPSGLRDASAARGVGAHGVSVPGAAAELDAEPDAEPAEPAQPEADDPSPHPLLLRSGGPVAARPFSARVMRGDGASAALLRAPPPRPHAAAAELAAPSDGGAFAPLPLPSPPSSRDDATDPPAAPADVIKVALDFPGGKAYVT